MALPSLSRGRRDGLRMTFSPFLDRSALRGGAAVGQMAGDLRTFFASAGCVLQEDLELLGWTPAQITLHIAAARGAAHKQSAGR